MPLGLFQIISGVQYSAMGWSLRTKPEEHGFNKAQSLTGFVRVLLAGEDTAAALDFGSEAFAWPARASPNEIHLAA